MKRKIISFIIAAVMLVGYSIPAFADETAQHLITINNEVKGHVYEAYQIFAGDLDKENTILSNVTWGNGIDGASLLTALKEEELYKDCTGPKDVAEILATLENDSEKLENFAKKADSYLKSVIAGTSVEKEGIYEISVTGDGYYLIKDKEEPGQGDAYTKFMLQVVKSVEVDVKADAPSIEKYIVEEGNLTEANSASVGDRVEYLLSSDVPKMDGYEKYFFVVHDTLSEGLTFDPSSVEIEIGGNALSEDAYQIVTENMEDGCSFEIVFKNFIQYKEQAGDEIQISYQAALNTDAEIGNTGNVNKAHLEYSNNPNVEADGDPENPDRPGVGDVTGETVDEITITYITAIEIFKIDNSKDALPLQGAEFSLTGEKLNQIKTVKGVYTEDVNGNYYKLKDGTYTDTPPADGTYDRYESTETLYTLSTETEWVTAAEKVGTTAMVDINGEVHFYGLSEGTYVIEEITAPNGYNLLEESVTVKIEMDAPDEIEDGTEQAVWKYSLEGAMDQEEQEEKDGIIRLSVVNKPGVLLPSTGGYGVYVFYLVSICLVVAAWIADTRKNRQDEN